MIEAIEPNLATSREDTMSDQEFAVDSIEAEAGETESNDIETAIEAASPAPIDGDIDPIAEAPGRPIDVPEKFWDSATNSIRTDALLKSYRQLEKKLGAMVPLPTDDDPDSRHRLQRALGRPESPDDYKIEAPHELLSPDPEINSKLHKAGLTSEQAQLVYNLAAEHMLPIIEKVSTEANQAKDLAQLASHFGGELAWQSIAPQLKTWAEANLEEAVYETLGSSFDGVVAIHQMMQNREPNMISEATVPTAGVDKGMLNQMMRDPRYWRDRDPAFIAQVTAGYKQLYD